MNKLTLNEPATRLSDEDITNVSPIDTDVNDKSPTITCYELMGKTKGNEKNTIFNNRTVPFQKDQINLTEQKKTSLFYLLICNVSYDVLNIACLSCDITDVNRLEHSGMMVSVASCTMSLKM